MHSIVMHKYRQLDNNQKCSLTIRILPLIIFSLYGRAICQELIEDRKVELSLNTESAISTITDFKVDSKGNFLIADGWRTHKVLVFNSEGKFVRVLGKRGQGPGEYISPVSLAISSKNEIYISDYLANRIVIYNENYSYTRNILCRPRLYYFIHLNNQDEIIYYTSSNFVANSHHTLFKYSRTGEFIKSFAGISKNVLELNFSAIYNGATLDKNNFIYEMHPLEYRIRKYDQNGYFIKEFNFPKGLKRIAFPEILNGPYVLDNNLVVIQRNNKIDIYDTEGTILKVGLVIPYKMLCTHQDKIYFEEWDYTSAVKNPIIHCYSLKKLYPNKENTKAVSS